MSNIIKLGSEYLKIYVDPKLLKRCLLTESQKMLLERIDVKGEKLTMVAQDLGKSKGTVSVQHKSAAQEYLRWTQREKQVEKTEFRKAEAKIRDLEKTLTARLDQLQEGMHDFGKYDDYLRRLVLLADAIGPLREKNCAYANVAGLCKKLQLSDPPLCAFCSFYVDKNAEPNPYEQRLEPKDIDTPLFTGSEEEL